MRITPIVPHRLAGVGDIFIKRDDLWTIAGVCGGKARSCWTIITQTKPTPKGVVTAGSRSSPQVKIAAFIATKLKMEARLHIPSGGGTEVTSVVEGLPGITIIRHTPGYNTVLISRAKHDAEERGFLYIPFGMECRTAVQETAAQVENIPPAVRRVVIPVGSGMSLAGVMWGMQRRGLTIPILGVVVGADPSERLHRWGPPFTQRPQLISSGLRYDQRVEKSFGGIPLDPIYEAKCVPFLEKGDLFWIVGHRGEP